MNAKKNYNVISALRIIACLMIIRGHYFDRFDLPEIFGKGIITGAGPVVVFFVISGFLAYEGFDRNPDTVSYFKRRALRIIPGYYIVLLCCIIAEQLVGIGFNYKLGILGWLRYFSFTNMLIPSYEFNAFNNLFGFWTMGCFPIFYLLTPLLYKWVNKKNGMYYLLAAGVLLNIGFRIAVQVVFGKVGFSEPGSFANLCPVSTLYLFVFGVIIAYSRKMAFEKEAVLSLGVIFLIMLATGKSGYVFWGIASALICIMPTINITSTSEILKKLSNSWIWRLGGGYLSLVRC